jgi:hypothetical protein
MPRNCLFRPIFVTLILSVTAADRGSVVGSTTPQQSNVIHVLIQALGRDDLIRALVRASKADGRERGLATS